MRTPTNHWKLGVFVVLGFVTFAAMVVFLGARSMTKDTVTYETYFDEAVQGLDVGSPVKFRGVTLGNVSAIDVAPDLRHVQVSCELTVTQLKALRLVETKPKKRLLPFGGKERVTLHVPRDLRTQLTSAGITGVKFVSMDFFDEKTNPPPELPFPVPENYVPAAASTMKNLEDALVKAINRFPEIADQLLATMTRADRVLLVLEQERLPERITATLERASRVMTSLNGAVNDANIPQLSSDTRTAVLALTRAVVQLDALLAKANGEQGLMASAQRATDSVGDVAGGAKALGPELAETLRGLREALDGVQRLSEALETDSDMLLKGRTRRKR
jgi:paraquat-inducible protein B